MKKLLLSLSLLVVIVSVVAIAANVDNYKEQGGARTVIGGSLDVVSGGDLDIESGGSFKVAGTALTATGTELNLTDADTYDDGGEALYRLQRSEWDASVDGGTSGTTYDLGEDLPANAIVTRNYFQIVTQIVDDGSGTIAIQCAGANDLYSAADRSGDSDGTIVEGVATGTAANMFDVGTSACDISLVVAGANASVGKLVHWVEYVVTE